MILLQWGFPYISNNTFPITYTIVPTVVAGGEYSWQGSDNLISTVSKTGFTAYHSASRYQRGWLSIGY